ncbi:MAG TPA: HNH endonuclease [Chitinophagaceae bacterium]|nr:HNH endonuclease [Chitinophagaceae bacterium]
MKLYVGITDNSWYNYVSSINPDDVNFWQPGGSSNFKVLDKLEPFLFKLKSPNNAIGGVGFFSSHTFLPMSMAWEVFGNKNGCNTFYEFQKLILQYRADKTNINPTIGCVVLTNPVFFKTEDWLEVPADWSRNIVQGKGYDTNTLIGQELWMKIERLLEKYLKLQPVTQNSQLVEEPSALYGNSILTKVRLGQSAFRVLVTDAYSRRCSVTGEKTLPVLEAAHIKSYALAGPHSISNGLLLRSDVHKLFDTGYLTVTENLQVEVSKRIREEFENGKEYYQYHGKELLYLPAKEIERPRVDYLQWHNENIYKG